MVGNFQLTDVTATSPGGGGAHVPIRRRCRVEMVRLVGRLQLARLFKRCSRPDDRSMGRNMGNTASFDAGTFTATLRLARCGRAKVSSVHEMEIFLS